MTTRDTVGFGDLRPAGQAARAIACLQFLVNAIFVAGLVRAIAYQAQARRAARAAHGDGASQSRHRS